MPSGLLLGLGTGLRNLSNTLSGQREAARQEAERRRQLELQERYQQAQIENMQALRQQSADEAKTRAEDRRLGYIERGVERTPVDTRFNQSLMEMIKGSPEAEALVGGLMKFDPPPMQPTGEQMAVPGGGTAPTLAYQGEPGAARRPTLAEQRVLTQDARQAEADARATQQREALTQLIAQVRQSDPQLAAALAAGLSTTPESPDVSRQHDITLEGMRQAGRSQPLVSTFRGLDASGYPIFERVPDVAGTQVVQPPPASAKPRGILGADSRSIEDIYTSFDEIGDLRSTVETAGATGMGAAAGAALPNWITSTTGIGVEAKSRQAVINRVKQIIGKTLEGGVLRKEDELKYKQILPTISDHPDVVKTKLEGLERMLKARLENKLESLEDAGYDIQRFRARQQETSLTSTGVQTATPPTTPAGNRIIRIVPPGGRGGGGGL